MSKKNILILGVGGTGSNAVDLLYQKIKNQGNPAGSEITAIVFDTDAGDMEKLKDATTIPLSDTRSVGTVCDAIGRHRIREWFPVPDDSERGNKYSAQELHKGASQWRKKSFLAFNGMLNDSARHQALDSALNAWIAKQPEGPFQILVVASIAGGTGSGSFIPLTLYVKNYLRTMGYGESDAYAMVACPGIYAAAQANIPGATAKIHANAYAIIRELNAMNLVTNRQAGFEGVHFHLGTQDAPTGILFDSDSTSFRDAARTPFKYIYLMDKLITCDSIQAHDSVLANSLYSLLCTEAGDGIDSIESNVVTTKDPRAIYAGVASAQMEFPLDTILSYAAHQKALDSIQKEWMILHNSVEDRIAREREEAQRSREAYSVSTAQYAEMYLDAMKQEDERDDSPLTPIFRDALNNVIPQTVGKPVVQDRLELYTRKILTALQGVIEAPTDLKNTAQKAREAVPKPKLFGRSDMEKLQSELPKKISNQLDNLSEYYAECDKKCRSTNFADRIFAWDLDREEAEYSLFANLLSKDGKFVHPVAAMAQLCRLRKYLSEQISALGESKWIAKRDEVPSELLTKGNEVKVSAGELKASIYMNERKAAYPQCLLTIANEPAKYKNQKTNAYVDTIQVYEDVCASYDNLEQSAKHQIKLSVLKDVAARVDMLIDGYRSFFKNFEKAKESLEIKVNSALHKGVKNNGGLLYAGASVEQKKALYAAMDTESNTPEAQAEGYAASGKGVFDAAHGEALQKRNSQKENAPQGSGESKTMFDNLFDALIKEFTKIMKGTDAYRNLQSKSILEVIAETAPDRSADSIKRAQRSVLEELVRNAKPSLRYTPSQRGDSQDKGPATASVITLAKETADYLRKNAQDLGLNAGNPSDSISTQNKSAAEDFFAKSGIQGAKVAIVDTVSPNCISLTCVLLNVLPFEIRHFDELAADTERNYFSYYQEAISHLESGRVGGGNEEDMWNPHLGNALHKRGHLPYINETMEAMADEKVAKAILYAFFKGLITHVKPTGQKEAFRCIAGGVNELIRQNGVPVTSENLVGLFDWLRPQEDRVDEWCHAFDREIERQLGNLSSADTTTEEAKLEGQISRSEEFITAMLRDNLFRNTQGLKDDEVVSKGLLEFAFVLSKTDRRDAEMLLRVGYEIFVRFCAFRFNLKTDAGLGTFCRICNQQTKKFMYKLLVDKTVEDSGDPLGYATQIVKFANSVTFTNGEKYGFRMRDSQDPHYKPGCFGILDNESGNGLLMSTYELDQAMLNAARDEDERREARRAARAAKAEAADAPAETPAEENGTAQ